MTPFFISRVFEEHANTRPEDSSLEEDESYSRSSPEMSLEDFSDFVLAWENRASALGVKYFFPVFDTRHAGFITQVRLFENSETCAVSLLISVIDLLQGSS